MTRTLPCTVPAPAARLYAEGLRAASAGLAHTLLVCDDTGRCAPLALHAWCAAHVAGDDSMLARCAGVTLDIGCGPGRLAGALAARGVPVLGVDVAATAVALTRRRGAAVLRASIFDALPGEGQWDTAVLADGNIGIGGDPAALLRRCAALVASGGRIVVELDPPGASRTTRLRLSTPTRHSEWFEWAHVGVDRVRPLARRVGLAVTEVWWEARRWFAVMTLG
jgi:SAM-dependent methyltransferase